MGTSGKMCVLRLFYDHKMGFIKKGNETMYIDKHRFKKHGTLSIIGEDITGKKIRIPIPEFIKTLDEAEVYAYYSNYVRRCLVHACG